MEFPSVGVCCSIAHCKRLDFLPLTCSHCQLLFCKEHFGVAAHACAKFHENITSCTKLGSYFGCSDKSCSNRSPVEMPCTKCGIHFCISHRHHGCLDIGEEERLRELAKWNAPKQEFSEAKKTVDEQIDNCLRKARNSAVANKVQLMRLKGRAVGAKAIPTEERRYFLVHPPVTGSDRDTGSPTAIYTCVRWSLGRTIDTFADTLGVPNTNNTAKSQKLRLFHRSTGFILSDRMDMLVSDLLRNSALIDGESLILEYCDNPSVDENLYQ